MAEDPKPTRPRASQAASHGAAEPPGAPITANTPLPPLNPLPLAAREGSAANPEPALSVAPGAAQDEPTVAFAPGNPAGGLPAGSRAGERGVNAPWAIGTIFLLLFTSLILLVVLAVSAANVSRSTAVLIWTMIIIILANILYALLVFSLGPRSIWGRLRQPFQRSRPGA